MSHSQPNFSLSRVQQDGILLALNRSLAGKLGLNPGFTISSNIAANIARATGMEFTTAKRLFHAGVAGFVGALVGMFGAGALLVLATAGACWAWLESFDSSREKR